MNKTPIGKLIAGLRGLFGALLLAGIFSANASAQQSVLHANEWLMPGQYMSSPNGNYQLWMQTDGNLVLYKLPSWTALWHTNTYMYPGLRAVMQGDGNFVLYDGWVDYGIYNAYWHSHTWQYPGAYLQLQDDGNLVIYAAGGYVPWATNTVQPTAPPAGCYPSYSGFASCITYDGGFGTIWAPGPHFSPWADIWEQYDFITFQPCNEIEPLPYAGDICY